MKCVIYSNHRACRALTLVELLVVLSILAVLSTVALRNVTRVVEDKSYDANISQLEEVREAVLGSSNASGFLGDIGRLPVVMPGDADGQLSELWESGGLPNYIIDSPSGDTEVRLGAGWRGPYLNLGINRSGLTDAFGNYFELLRASGVMAGDGEAIEIVRSLGGDGISGGSGFNEDFELVFEAVAETNWLSSVSVNVVGSEGDTSWNDGGFLVVRAYGADGIGRLHTVDQPPSVVLTTNISSQSVDFDDLVRGPKVFRAYRVSMLPPNKDSDIADSGVERKSPATHVIVGRRTPTITLVLY